MHDLINAWRRFDGTKAPHLLEGDRDALTRHGHSRRYGSWENYIGSQDFLLSSPDLHLDLLPVPYVGDLAKASIFLLLLNPGLSPVDYYAEYKVGSFRRTGASRGVPASGGLAVRTVGGCHGEPPAGTRPANGSRALNWWRRGELNPRPRTLRYWIYMRIRSINLI